MGELCLKCESPTLAEFAPYCSVWCKLKASAPEPIIAPALHAVERKRGRPIISLSGKRFGRLTVRVISERRGTGRAVYWHCRCDCGRMIEVRGSSLTAGNTTSCGCLRVDASRERALTMVRDGTDLHAKPEPRRLVPTKPVAAAPIVAPKQPARTATKPGSFDAQLEAILPNLRKYSYALAYKSRGMVDKDDLFSSTMVMILRKQHLWEPGSSLIAWSLTVMHNNYVNICRLAARTSDISVPMYSRTDSLGTDVALPALEKAVSVSDSGVSLLVRDLVKNLRKMPVEQAITIWLVGYHGLDYEQCADVMRVPVGTVRSRLSRGRELLRALCGEAPSSTSPWLNATSAKRRAAKMALSDVGVGHSIPECVRRAGAKSGTITEKIDAARAACAAANPGCSSEFASLIACRAVLNL